MGMRSCFSALKLAQAGVPVLRKRRWRPAWVHIREIEGVELAQRMSHFARRAAVRGVLLIARRRVLHYVG